MTRRGVARWRARAVAVLLAASERAGAELPDFTVRHWDQGRGLPQASVTSLAQSADGFLWVGTFGGLSRFDGVAFRRVALGGEASVESYGVLCLLAEPGALWVGTDRGLYTLAGDVLRAVPMPPAFARRPVASVFRGADGTLWVGAANDGVARWDHGAFVPVPACAEGLYGLQRLQSDPSGRLLLWSERRGVLRLSGDRLEAVTGAALVAAQQRLVPAAPAQPTAPLPDRLAGPSPSSFSAGVPYFVAARSLDGSVWYGDARGLSRANPSGESPVLLAETHPAHVMALLTDREGGVWVGTDGDGLYQLAPRLFHALTRFNGLPGASVHGIGRDDAGTVWAAFACDGLARIDPVESRVLSVWSSEALGGCPWTSLPARGGGQWVGVFQGPMVRVDESGAVRALAARMEGVTALFRDSTGEVWAGTRERGAYRFSDGAELYAEPIAALPGRRVSSFAEDASGRVWIATDNGVAVWDHGVLLDLRGRGLPTAPARALLADGDRMWVGTFGAGLSVESGGRFVRIDTRRGLYEDVVSWIQADRDWIWWTGNEGVYRATRAALLAAAGDRSRTVHPERFTRAEGMPSNETNGGAQPAGFTDPAGRLWIPTIAGIAWVDPASLDHPLPAPRARIERVLVDGVEVAREGVVRLPVGVRHVEVEFTAVAMTFPDRVVFATRLDGLDSAWVPVGARRRVEYSRLRPGRYTFRVAAAQDDARWDRADASLTLDQRPAVFESWPFRALLGLFAMSLGAALYRERTLLLRRRTERALATLERERRALEAQSVLVRDLHDGIGGIVANIGLMASLGERSESLDASARALHHIGMLAQEGSSEVRTLMNTLEARDLRWSDLVAEIRRHGAVLLSGHDIELTLTAEGVPEDVRVDPRLALSMFRIVKEALNNAVKHSGARSVRVLLSFRPGHLTLSIRDDGHGLSEAPGHGRGLANMHRRARDLGGTFTIESDGAMGLVFELPIASGGSEPPLP